jgi:hypothetical protein
MDADITLGMRGATSASNIMNSTKIEDDLTSYTTTTTTIQAVASPKLDQNKEIESLVNQMGNASIILPVAAQSSSSSNKINTPPRGALAKNEATPVSATSLLPPPPRPQTPKSITPSLLQGAEVTRRSGHELKEFLKQGTTVRSILQDAQTATENLVAKKPHETSSEPIEINMECGGGGGEKEEEAIKDIKYYRDLVCILKIAPYPST